MSVDFIFGDKELQNNSGLLNAKIYTTVGEAVVTILHWTQSLKTLLYTVLWQLTKTDSRFWIFSNVIIACNHLTHNNLQSTKFTRLSV